MSGDSAEDDSVTPQSDEEEEELGYECANCLSAAPKNCDCPVCGAEPHDGEGYRVECCECGATEIGGHGADAQWDMRYHRIHHCPDAAFEVTAL